MPVGQINGEALDRAQRIVVRNAKRAEAARLRYHRMTPEARRNYNQRRYTPKAKNEPNDERLDALKSIEKEISRQTRKAQQALKAAHQNNGVIEYHLV